MGLTGKIKSSSNVYVAGCPLCLTTFPAATAIAPSVASERNTQFVITTLQPFSIRMNESSVATLASEGSPALL